MIAITANALNKFKSVENHEALRMHSGGSKNLTENAVKIPSKSFKTLSVEMLQAEISTTIKIAAGVRWLYISRIMHCCFLRSSSIR